MGIVDDLGTRLQQLKTLRQPFEALWQEIADLALPTASAEVRRGRDGLSRIDSLSQPPSREAARRRFDSLPARAGMILASGMESLTTPAGQFWHGYAAEGTEREETDEEGRYFERLQKLVFGLRGDPRCGFALANQMSCRNAIFFGHGIIWAEANPAGGRAVPIHYQSIPITQAFIDIDARGEPDTFFRPRSMPARLMAKLYEGKVSSAVKAAAENTSSMDQAFEIVHAVFPRQEIGSSTGRNRRSKYASFIYEAASKQILAEDGYDEFPAAVEYWDRVEESPYGESSIGLAIDEIRSLMFTRKIGGTAFQLAVRPPMGTAFEGVMNRLNMNPGANNPGAVGADGRLKIQRILEAPNLQHVLAVTEAERQQVQRALMTEFFQTLAETPNETATAVLVKLQEKGDILGPAGSKRQAALAHLGEREIGILARSGLFSEGSAYMPPESLSGRGFGFKWSSPLEQLRAARGALGTQRLVEMAIPILSARQILEEEFSIERTLRYFRDAFGAQKDITLTDEERAQIQQQKAQQMQAAMAMQAGPAAAKTAKDGADAMATAASVPGMMEGLDGLARAGAAAA